MIALSVRLFQLLMLAYPAPFRHEFSGEMVSMFRARCEDEAAAQGWWGVLLVWPGVLFDTAVTVPQEHYFMLTNDLRYAVRSLRKSAGFTIAALSCLALGIGASTAIFSIVNAVVLKPLPYRDSGQYARLYTEFPGFPGGGLKKFWVSPPEFRELRQQGRAWDRLEAWAVGEASLDGGSEPVRINLCYLSGGMMPLLGVTPRLGTWIIPANDNPGAVTAVVLSDGLWKRSFGANPQIAGKEVWLNGSKGVIAGVMPEGFEFPPGATEPSEAWAPLQITEQQMKQRGSHFLSLVAHLKQGETVAHASGDLRRIENALGAGAAPAFHAINHVDHPLRIAGFQDEVVGGVKKAMLMLLGAVAFFLLIACVNVANLLLARSDSRRREIAVRKAIGAGLPQLIRQFAVEGLLLSGTGAALGVLLAWLGVRFIVATDSGSIPRLREAGVDGRVLLFTVVVAVATGLLFCMAPMLQSVRQPVSEALKAAGGRTLGSAATNRFRGALVISEVALALVLLIGSGLLVRAFWKLQQVDAGIRTDHLLTARISLSNQTFRDGDKLRQFWTRLNERLQATPGVVSATMASGLPPERNENDNDTEIENFVQRKGGPVQNVAYYQRVGDRFFETLGARLIEGRYFDERDGFGAAPVVIVNQSMARAFWPGESAVGKRIRPSGSVKDWLSVVGVVADIRNGGLTKPAATEIFLPARQFTNASQNVYAIVRTTGNPELVANLVREAVRATDPSVPVSKVRTMEDVMGASESRPRFLAAVLTLFSALALTLAGLGIYGVVSYSVAQRTPEFGIRMALGAARGDVLRLVLFEGGVLTAFGVAAGCAGAVLCTRVLQDLLFEVSPVDVATFSTMAALLVLVSLVACLLPARRATIVDPLRALRYE
jgi:predicted permease